MQTAPDQDELLPSSTAGYKPPAQKTLQELQELDQNDESLAKWKAELLKASQITGDTAAVKDPRKVVVLSLAMEVEGRPDVVLDLSAESQGKSSSSSIVIKEGVDYRMKIQFKVQHDVVCGLKYLHVVKRAGIRVDKTEEMIGSYAPNPTEVYEKKFLPEQAPSGMLARGTYSVKSRCIDDDENVHMELNWQFEIKKDW